MKVPMDPSKETIRLTDSEVATVEEFEVALLHWDELDRGSLEILAAHPLHGPRLNQLQRTEAWLHESVQAETPPAVSDCPSSEELYDYGQGPAATPLPRERRAELDRHLARCRDCEALVATLTMSPAIPIEELLLPQQTGAIPSPHRQAEPSPILDGPRPRRGASARPRRRRQWITLLPLAAAASILAVSFLAPNLFRGSRNHLLPEAELMRGSEVGSLIGPRGLLLWNAGGQIDGLPTGSSPRFALLAEAGASSYQVEIRRVEESGFSKGKPVATLLGDQPELGRQPLEAGRYTWSATATVNGILRDLGARDVEVRENAELLEQLKGLDTLDAVILLFESGYQTDARELARSLPPSTERDAFIGQLPPR